jgi:hypothetical protein
MGYAVWNWILSFSTFIEFIFLAARFCRQEPAVMA